MSDDKTERIKFLIARKFPSLILASLSSAPERNKQPSHKFTYADIEHRRQEAEKYRAELQALASGELQSLFESETAKAEAEKAAEAEREEEARFFHHPTAAADFEHWSKAAHWSLEEALALAFGKAPELVSWSTIHRYQQVSPFVFRYARLRDLAQRAMAWQKLFDPVLPIIFVNWAKENDIDFPADLAEKVIGRSSNSMDWKALFEQLKKQSDEHIADWRRIVEERNDLLETSIQNCNALNSALEQCKAELASKSDRPLPEKPQSSREREGMLKVIYAMAVGGYGYVPTAGRSKLVPEILKDLELQGLSLSDDTVRRYITAACELLPEWREAAR
jgi:hypothetical protein